jgi:hypothetical protein
MDPEYLEWIKSLKKGDHIDAIKYEVNINDSNKKICWSRA